MNYVLQKLNVNLLYEKGCKEVAEKKLKTRGILSQEAVSNYQQSLDTSLSRIKELERAIFILQLEIEEPIISAGDEEESHF